MWVLAPALPARRRLCGSPGKIRAARGWRWQQNSSGEAAHLQSEVGQQAGGSHRWRGFLGRLPPCPQTQEQIWAVPRGRVPEKPRSLQATGFQGGEEERKGRRRERRGEEEEEEGGGGRNWETEV